MNFGGYWRWLCARPHGMEFQIDAPDCQEGRDQARPIEGRPHGTSDRLWIDASFHLPGVPIWNGYPVNSGAVGRSRLAVHGATSGDHHNVPNTNPGHVRDDFWP